MPLLEASGLFKEPSVRSEDLSRRCIQRNQLNESPKFEVVEIRALDESTTYKKISREWIKLRSLVDASCSGWSPSRDVVSSMRNSGIKPDAQNTTPPSDQAATVEDALPVNGSSDLINDAGKSLDRANKLKGLLGIQRVGP